jgi:hypothetical protein
VHRQPTAPRLVVDCIERAADRSGLTWDAVTNHADYGETFQQLRALCSADPGLGSVVSTGPGPKRFVCWRRRHHRHRLNCVPRVAAVVLVTLYTGRAHDLDYARQVGRMVGASALRTTSRGDTVMWSKLYLRHFCRYSNP